MENYLENHKKYNKILFKYLGYNEKEVDYKQFSPHDPLMGYEILRWVMHKINHNPKEGYKMKIIATMRDESAEVFIQEWHDVLKSNGYVCVVHCKEECKLDKQTCDKNAYEEELINISHRAAYNACVDYIIKIS